MKVKLKWNQMMWHEGKWNDMKCKWNENETKQKWKEYENKIENEI